MVDYCIIDKKENVVWKTTNTACYAPIYQSKHYIDNYLKDLSKHHYYNNNENILRISVPKNNGIDLEILQKICCEFSKNNLKMFVKEGVDYKNQNRFLLDIPFKHYKSINHLKLATHLTRVLIESYTKDNVLFKALEYKEKYPKSNFLRNVIWMSTFYSSGGHNYLTNYQIYNNYVSEVHVPKKINEIKKMISENKETKNYNNVSFSAFCNNCKIVKKLKNKINDKEEIDIFLKKSYNGKFKK